MLRELIAWVLNNYLGKYVHNLNTAQLSVALLSGEVELENLPLRKDALRNLGLPLQALKGTVGRIKLQIPVRQFRTAPWCIIVEDVYVVIGPINLDEWDTDAEEQAELNYKLSRLDNLEAKWRAQREAALEGGYYASSYSGWLSYGTSLATNIIENLELKIKNVHIRYEDAAITVHDQRFACGITIDSLSARSCDSNWIAGFSSSWNQTSASFKLVELTSMSIYWQPLNNQERFADSTFEELVQNFQQWKTATKHEYIVSPVSAQARFKRDRSEMPLRTRSRPRLTCDLILNEVQLTLSDWQYKQMVECVRGLDDISKYRRFRLLRPEQSVHEAPKAWWLYAARCNGVKIVPRHSIRNITKENLRYIDIYTKLIINPNETLSNEQKDFKDKIEKERDYYELKFLREVCMSRIPNDDVNAVDTNNQGRGMLLQWFPQWWGWYKTPQADPQSTDALVISTISSTDVIQPKDQNQLEDEILNALSSGTVDNSLLKRDTVFGKFNFTLKKGVLDICSSQNNMEKIMLQLQFQNLLLDVETRPRSGSHFVGLSLGSVLLKDFITENSEFPDLIKPQVKEDATTVSHNRRSRGSFLIGGLNSSNSNSNASLAGLISEPIFQLNYERKPLSHNTDYRLLIKTQSLDVVYNIEPIKWIVDFVMKPYQMINTRKKIEAMKNKTKAELIKNWENILEGDVTERRTWTLEIDISAPQIIFVENFAIKNSTVIVIDFGRLQLTNFTDTTNCSMLGGVAAQTANKKDDSEIDALLREQSEDEDAFVTPCSTPPGSQASNDSPTLCSALSDVLDSNNSNGNDTANGNLYDLEGSTLNERSLHEKLYDRYKMDLTDLQVLVCKSNERWLFASAKGSSTLHVLDRFSISLQVERRAVHTNDPQYPNLTIAGTLPKLNAHVNEQKITAITTMLNIISSSNIQSPHRTPNDSIEDTFTAEMIAEECDSDNIDGEATNQRGPSNRTSIESENEASKLFMLQFSIDQMSLEVQSRGRCIAELQVTGVKAAFSKRPEDINVTLSVHGLLLVDAIQSFGPDFELLIASHRHVGMDSISGSLKQSEPCSPISPASPDPMIDRRPHSPNSISRAISNLQRNALITVEVLLVTPEVSDGEYLQIANIQFNNLDIIANQETIVELMGFANRVFPRRESKVHHADVEAHQLKRETPITVESTPSNTEPKSTSEREINSDASANVMTMRTEITFDFHRLNVLVLRAVMRDTYMVGRKVGTFTMSEAKIHATLGNDIRVEGSLGGLQVIDLTPEGISHQRILSVGKDPLTEAPIPPTNHDLLSSLTQEVYGMSSHHTKHAFTLEDQQALSFCVTRNLSATVTIRIRMASVWYTHCARFMQELNWCATEFKHYLKNFARSIRDKATDMALGLVQPNRDIPTATPKAPVDIHQTPKHMRKQRTISFSNSAGPKSIDVRMDIVLDTPVLVLPRSSRSPQVFVVHLGKISMTNNQPSDMEFNRDTPQRHLSRRKSNECDLKIFTIDEELLMDASTTTLVNNYSGQKNEYFSEEDIRCKSNDTGIDDCDGDDRHIETYILDIRNINAYSLDTRNRKSIRLSALPRAEEFYSCQEDAVPVLYDTAIRVNIVRCLETPSIDLLVDSVDSKELLQINGSVIKPLNLSLSRVQYEQLLETTENLFKVPNDLARPPNVVPSTIKEREIEQSSDFELSNETFEIDSKFKRRLFQPAVAYEKKTMIEPKVAFELPIFIIQLKSALNDPLIDIVFRDFNVNYETTNTYETNLQVSLRSLLMEDLLQSPDSKHRAMLVSSSPDNQQLRSNSAYSSRSCPNLIGPHFLDDGLTGSLPERLESGAGFSNYLHPNNNTQQSFNWFSASQQHKTNCPETPPPSPQRRMRQDNLVLYSSLIVDPECPNFATQYNSMRQTSSIDFNSLDLIVSVKSWFAFLNFFGVLSDTTDDEHHLDAKHDTTIESTTNEAKKDNSDLEVSVRSLTLVFVRPDYELAKANVSNAHFLVTKTSGAKTVKGRLGSVSLFDLTVHGALYRERFLTSGNEALNFTYSRDEPKRIAESATLNSEALLKIKMSSVRYVHTKRFIAEIQTFVNEFQGLQAPNLIRKIKSSESRSNLQQKPMQLSLSIKAGSPIILLPLSAKSNKVIVADLGEFSLRNSFHFASDTSNVISVRKDVNGPDEILDVMLVDLVNTDLFAGERHLKNDDFGLNETYGFNDTLCMDMGSYIVCKNGASLLNDKCHLKLIVERNLQSWRSHNVPDFSVQGTLSRLEAVLNLQQYQLVRGFLQNNLGEPLDDLDVVQPQNITDSRFSLSTENFMRTDLHESSLWTSMSITLDLQDVSVRLQVPKSRGLSNLMYDPDETDAPLACINFIKSSLKIDQFSDGSQDIDLVSQEILVTDTRFTPAKYGECFGEQPIVKNVFTTVLQPTGTKSNGEDSVQAEVHSRKRQDYSKYTILLNNMRVMAILDWMECVRDFLSQDCDEHLEASQNNALKVQPISSSMSAAIAASTTNINASEMEVILNITNSELVFVEKTDQWDSNAVILKSTTVLSYRPIEVNKVMSINLNHLEVFSCILGCEEDTALSIIDPITINMDVKQNTLDIQLQKRLCIRLSYNDVKMFIKMFESLPNQTKNAQSRDQKQVNEVLVAKLSALGFSVDDCIKALELCNNILDDSALWLTQHAEPVKMQSIHMQESALNIKAVVIRASCISICVIDDCKDADVPLLEVSFSELEGRQELGSLTDYQNMINSSSSGGSSRAESLVPTTSGSGYKVGYLKGVFASDYYNRVLSGWEPLIESWKCESNWSCSVGASSIQPNRLHLLINSDDILKLNITTTIIELFNLVYENWMQDYYGSGSASGTNDGSPSTSMSLINYRRRSPFVPFALKNETGLNLQFTTFVSAPGTSPSNEGSSDVVSRKLNQQQWISVEPGAVIPFTFGPTNKQRHHDSHKLTLHQIRVRIDGWTEVGPVSIDKVGVFFRYSRHEMAEFISLPRARIVFSVSLEGSAQKLVTVRSALRVINRLDRNMLIKLEHLKTINYPDAITAILKVGETYSVPLSHVNAHMYVVPISTQNISNTAQLSMNTTNDTSSRSDGSTKYQTPERQISSNVDLWLKKSDSNESRLFFCERSIYWRDMDEGLEVQQWVRTCKSSRDKHFRVLVAVQRDGYPMKDSGTIPGHSIILLPPLRLHNLLPCDLLFRLANNTLGRISPSETANIYEVDLENQMEITITLDSYPGAEKIIIPSGPIGSADYRIRLTDTKGRPLILRASIQMIKGSGLQITISSPYWLINRTGLPLIFRQEGVSQESSGQFDEHEQARLVSPLMFSFTDPDASPALTVRLGRRYGANPPWCQPFNLHKDIIHQQLRSGISNETFIIGTEVRCGRGRYAKTRVVTFSPRFQLYNRSSYKLQFAQKCFANSSMDLSAPNTFIEAVPGCHLPFHWPRLDKEQELCVRLPNIDGCMWSGAVPIHETQSLYINIRNMNGDMHFLRLEIVLQGATYFLLFGDAQALPPPIRLDNYSNVAIKFYQPGGRNHWRTIIRPHSSMAYALDEPMGIQSLVIEAPGGVSHNYSLNELGTSFNLTYENYIYIAFSGTFRSSDKDWSDYDIECQELVLTVVDGRVYLAKKQQGNRSQLWRMNQDRQLEHEGSSPPIEPGKKTNTTHRLVLDLEKAPQPRNYVPLVVRPVNKQRRSTQTWKFTEEGRLMCEHSNMCVQVRGGIFGLRPESEAVLGMIVSDTHLIRDGLVPIEQSIRREKLRAGSGFLSVSIGMDGPIKNIRIRDVKSTEPVSLALDPTWKHVSNILSSENRMTQSHSTATNVNTNDLAELYVNVKLTKGIGISIVSKQPCEELAFVTLENILTEAISTPNIRSLDFSVGDIQIDNNLFETPCPVMLFTTRNSETQNHPLPAMHLNVKSLPSPNANAIIFEHLTLSLRPLTIYLEERLILRLAMFLGLGKSQNDTLPDESDYEAHRVATKILAANAKRYYFGDLQIVPSQIRLSVITASKLMPQLLEIKKSLGLTLIKFEDAVIDFEKFTDRHHFETLEVYLRAIKAHYKQQLKWQAAFILGSVDFLGNPLGFASDLSEGVSGLIFEGSVKSLVKNVTHGISNSTAKLTETISDGLGRVVLDEQDTETRQRILEMPSGSSSTGDHLVAGFKGLSFGLLGGVTSIVKHTYIGAQNDGFQGFISGLGKGIVGTVTKPVIGVLDLASETANAVRETSKSSNRALPERKRLSRCVTGAPGGLLPPYSSLQSRGQSYLFLINKRNFNEQFMAYEPCLYDGRDSKLRLLVSSENIWVFSRNEESTTVILSYHLSELMSCRPVNKSQSKRGQHYIELCLNLQDAVKRPLVRCSNEEMAQRASRHINYAKSVYDERELTLNYETVIDT
ncbi:vacuolar protein sorting-associated protein 13D isoform X2 [Contarinia nasturtii]|uniref:vacuolar protein sorting-associated protein 13D isoform X2 n=1 Tax=Contarinia nasturtii TaxID=265458 RepID=UPI0012D3A3B5|nr:vacuolar protein sorting-associated protein 13D isoform X2 [Contarinia nasturtii]